MPVEPVREEAAGTRFGAAAVLLAASVLLSRLLGFVREAVLAWQVGAGPTVDAYRAAFQLPDLLNYFLAGGALSVAFIPLYTATLAREGRAAAERLAATVLGTVGVLVVVVTAVAFWLAEPLVALQFPRFDPEVQSLTVHLTRIVLPAQIFFLTGGVLRAVLMAEGSFRAQAAAPVLYNAGIIAGGVLLGSRLGVEGFAWGALAGAVIGPFGFALFDATRRVRVRVRFAPADPGFRRYLVLAAPLAFGVTLLTVDEWYDRWFGALQAAGTVANLGYARQLMLIPVAVVGQAVAAAALPTLSRLFSAKRHAELDRALTDALRGALGLAALCGGAFLIFAEPIVRAVYERGAFGSQDTAQVARLLAIFAFAVPGWVVQQIAVRSFYAREEMWRPMLLGTAVALGMAPLYLVLGRRFGGPGLALAGAVGVSTNALVTLVFARVWHGGPSLRAVATSAARSLGVAAVAAGGASLVLRGAPGLAGALLDLALGGAVYGGLALAGVFTVGDAVTRGVVVAGLRRLAGRHA